jgi:DNA repair exonuclease SbcCD nuclease subunit
MGDYLDSICIGDKRFDPMEVDRNYRIKDLSNLANNQLNHFLELIDPIKDKVICFLSGNHEDSLRRHSYLDITLELCRKLSVPYLGYNGFIQLTFKRQVSKGETKGATTIYTIYAIHGFGASRNSGSKVNKMEDVAHVFNADLILMAHEHKKIAAPPVLRLGLNSRGKLIQEVQNAVMTGSFLRGFVEGSSSYVERSGYHPTDLGVPIVTIKPDIKETHITI